MLTNRLPQVFDFLLEAKLGPFVWIGLFGVWPLADPGHDDLSNPLVWLDLALHLVTGMILFAAILVRTYREGYEAGKSDD